MTEKEIENQGQQVLENKLFRVKPEASRQFNILKAEQGAASGPRLIAEALDLLFEKYGKKKIGFGIENRPVPMAVAKSGSPTHGIKPRR